MIQPNCPVCHAPLHLEEKRVCCPQGHSFDRARQGYLNLLLAQQKRSKAPGDSAEMVAARARFLEQDYYRPLVNRLATHLAGQARQGQLRWLDLGCGEGYFTQALDQQLRPGLQMLDTLGIDISKAAILAACRRAPQLQWWVASAARPPVADETLDAALQLFVPAPVQGLANKLRRGGRLLYVVPGEEHLLELRQALYPSVIRKAAQAPTLPDGWQKIAQEDCEFRFAPAEHWAALLDMTPHGKRCKPEQRDALLNAPPAEVRAHFTIWVLERQA